MVITLSSTARRRQHAWLLMELVFAIAILLTAMMPLAYSVHREQKLLRAYYQKAVLMEILDGEMEVLAAGGWKSFSKGTHDYPVEATAARNLPPGRFTLTIGSENIRLQWVPQPPLTSTNHFREVRLENLVP